jgi:hypothetical protein
MAEPVDEQETEGAGVPASTVPTYPMGARQTTTPSETVTDDPEVVRTSRPIAAETATEPTVLRTTHSIAAERHQSMVDRYGGFYWGADFIGFAVAAFFTLVFLGIVGAIVGAVGFQMGVPVPKSGSAVTQATTNLTIGALIGSLGALFLAFLIGGYTAGRMARYDGPKNGIGVVIWTIIVAVALSIIGAVLGSSFNVASQLHLKIDATSLTTAGVVSLIIALVVMTAAAVFGGALGERYHRVIDRDAGVV